MDEFELLQKRLKFGQKALLILAAVIVGLILALGKFTGKTDENCEKYNTCQER